MKRHLLVCTVALVCFAAATKVQSNEYGEYGGFVSNEEDRFVDYVWEFVEELGEDCTNWLNICGDLQDSWINDKYKRTHYVYGSCRQLISQANYYVDSVDIAYVAGHGNASRIWMKDSEGSCDLSQASWGTDLESIVLHSCKILAMDSSWRLRWKRTSTSISRPFDGLHQALGFTTNHNNGVGAGGWTADEFAENLEDGMSVRYAWYEAVEDGYWLSPYAVIAEGKNKQAVFYTKPHRNETLKDQYNGKIPDRRYGMSDYLIYAYYRN